MQGWKEKFLSSPGKEILIKAIAQAILAYVMSCFRLPDSLVDEIQAIVARFWWGSKEEARKIHWKSWSHMCLPKRMGGMGFRDLKAFNQALLAKQGWRILNGGQSLISRVFKAKYFKNSDFLEARRGHNPSYTWASIWGAKSLLLEGLKWRVGDGSKINVWTEAWLPGESSCLVPTPKPHSNPNLMVADLIDRDSKSWNLNVIEHELEVGDAYRVQQIILSERLPEDTRFWWPTKDGKYTTKSGYWLGFIGHRSSSTAAAGVAENNIWKVVWNIEGPPKLHHFAWRISTEAVAVKETLFRKHITAYPICPICLSHNESVIHALFECDMASEAWMTSPFLNVLFEAPNDSLQNRLLWCKEKMSSTDFAAFMSTAWAIWCARNSKIFQERQPDVRVMVNAFLKLTADYTSFCSKMLLPRPSPGPTSNTDWLPPAVGFIKINTDAGMIGQGCVGLGMIARDENGNPIAAAVKRVQLTTSPDIAEVLAGLWGVQVARRLGFERVILESDALSLISMLKDYNCVLAPIGIILDDILAIASTFVDFDCSHVKRVGNTVAHYIARMAPPSGSEHVFVDSFPQGLFTLLGFDQH